MAGAIKSGRFFIALWPGPRTRDAIASYRDARAGANTPQAAPHVADDLHLTLHFIGALEPARVAALCEALANVHSPPFVVRLGTPALWPHGVAVLEPAAVPTALRVLHAEVAGALRAVGIPVEPRAWRPHVTLARRSRGGVLPAKTATIAWPVRGFALVASQRVGDRRYRVLQRFALTTATASA